MAFTKSHSLPRNVPPKVANIIEMKISIDEAWNILANNEKCREKKKAK